MCEGGREGGRGRERGERERGGGGDRQTDRQTQRERGRQSVCTYTLKPIYPTSVGSRVVGNYLLRSEHDGSATK